MQKIDNNTIITIFSNIFSEIIKQDKWLNNSHVSFGERGDEFKPKMLQKKTHKKLDNTPKAQSTTAKIANKYPGSPKIFFSI